MRSKALIQYFCPYDSVDLRKMALYFNTPLPDLENELMQLILDGHIKARIDSINKILYAKHTNQRVETFEKTMSMAQQYSRYMHISVLKSQMIKHQLKSKLSKVENLNNTIKR